MKRQFSTREKVLLAVLALLLLGCVYYILVARPVQDTLLDAAQRQSAAESELTVASARLEQMHQMQAALDGLAQTAEADVPDYDNAQNVVNLLNQAMALSDEYSLSFQPVTMSGAIATRAIDMSFTCADYGTSKQILRTLLDSPYRCRVTSVSLSCGDNGDIRQSTVTVTASVVFYEYLSPDQRVAAE